MNGILGQIGNGWKVQYTPYWVRQLTPDIFSQNIYVVKTDISETLKKRQGDLINFTIKELLVNLKNIGSNFDDITYRQESWVNFKKDIEALWSLTTEDNSKRIVLLLMDSVKNLKAEKMNKSHVDGFQEVLQILSSKEIFMYDMFQITQLLIDHQIPVLRFPKGASELLD